MPCDDDATARCQAGADCSAGGRGSEHAIDSASRRGRTWGCQHLAASVCRSWPRGAEGPAATGQDAELYGGNRQTHPASLDEPPPAGYARWTGPLIADRLGDVHEQHVWRVLREQKIDLAGRKSWCESNDPQFVAKAADVVGLYVAPPENAIVICVDEKPSIQALERAQGYLKLANGRTLTGHSHDYKRNGTSTLFAAFEVATGKVKAAHKKRRRRLEFLEFMNDIVAAYPAGTAIHVVLDNLNTHKPRNDCWLKRHRNVHFHFTPTRASWLNQVEIWFSILQGNSLSGASFNSIKQLREHIDAFIEAYNENATPFVWTKAKVRQRRVKNRRISDL